AISRPVPSINWRSATRASSTPVTDLVRTPSRPSAGATTCRPAWRANCEMAGAAACAGRLKLRCCAKAGDERPAARTMAALQANPVLYMMKTPPEERGKRRLHWSGCAGADIPPSAPCVFLFRALVRSLRQPNARGGGGRDQVEAQRRGPRKALRIIDGEE